MCTKEQQGSITIVFLVSSCPSLLPTGGLGPCHARFFLFPISPSFVHFKYSALVLYLNTVFILMLLCSKILSPARENPSSLIPRHPFILPLCPGTSSCSRQSGQPLPLWTYSFTFLSLAHFSCGSIYYYTQLSLKNPNLILKTLCKPSFPNHQM